MLVGLEKTRNQVKIYNVGSEDQTNVKLKLTGSSMAEEAGKATSKTCSGAWAESNPQNGSPNLAVNKPSAKPSEKILMKEKVALNCKKV
jgi:hypothetical protein